MVDILFDQDTVTEFWLDELINDSREEGMKEGIQQGRQEERTLLLNSLVSQGLLTEEEAKRQKGLVNK